MRKKLSVNNPKVEKVGRKPMLTEPEEQLLVNYINDSSLRAMPVTKITLLKSVNDILEADAANDYARDLYTPNSGLEGWYRGFRRRHPEIVIRTPETLTRARRNLSVTLIQQWFSDVKTYLYEHQLIDILDDDERMFNLDEIGFSLDPGTGKVLCTTGTKNCFVEQSNSHKTNITILANVRGDGVQVPPVVIYPMKRISVAIANKIKLIPKQYAFDTGKSDSGYIIFETFYEYITNTFNKWLIKNNVKKPVIVFTDWHESRNSKYLSQALEALDIVMIGLLPNTTHILQPLDVSVFGPFKKVWRRAARSYIDDNNEFITKETFANVAIPLYYRYITKKNIQSGFRKCGLYPFNAQAPDYSKLIANTARKAPDSTIFECIDQGNKTSFYIE